MGATPRNIVGYENDRANYIKEEETGRKVKQDLTSQRSVCVCVREREREKESMREKVNISDFASEEICASEDRLQHLRQR